MSALGNRNFWLWGGLLLVLGAVNWSVWQKEQLLVEGRTVLLQLAPVDPRSLMQGDYMRLDYALTRNPQPGGPLTAEVQAGATRVVRLKLDAQQVATVMSMDTPAPLNADEARMLVRKSGNRNWRMGSDAYFFQEGTGNVYARARFGEYVTAPDGESVLVALRDEQRNRIGPYRLGHRWQVPVALHGALR